MEEKKTRSLEEINQEYFQTAARAGEVQYKIERMKSDLDVFNKRLLELNFEAASAQAEAAKKEAEKKLAEAEAAKAASAEQGASNG